MKDATLMNHFKDFCCDHSNEFGGYALLIIVGVFMFSYGRLSGKLESVETIFKH